MSEECRGSMSGFTIAIVGAIVFLLAYILSPVPVQAILSHSSFNNSDSVQTAFETVYFPIAWMIERSPTVETFYDCQIQFFVRLGISP